MESKFIVAQLAQEVIVLVDQHAAAERVELERLQRRAVQGDASALGPAAVAAGGAEVPMANEELRWLAKHRAQLERWGFRWCAPTGPGPGLRVTHVPEVLGTRLAPADLRGLLAEAETAPLGDGAPPRAVLHILAFKACRRAVKFGDAMSEAEMARLLRDLSSCEFPFQCAHGRPTVYPLLSVPALRRLGEAVAARAAPEPPLLRWLAAQQGR